MASRMDIHFQPGASLIEFKCQYGTEEQCHKHLFRLKWSKGYRCPRCGHKRHYFIESRSLKNKVIGTCHGMNHNHFHVTRVNFDSDSIDASSSAN